MPFKTILADIVDENLGVCSAIVADWEGEAVDWLASAQCDDEDLRICGAHLGIVLKQFVAVAAARSAGEVEELIIRNSGAVWFVFPITSEYYLAVIARHGGYKGQVCRRAVACVQALKEEIV